MSPHDRLVKKALGAPEHAAGELRAVLPAALCSRIDWSTLRAERGSFVDEDAREHHTDLLFSAELGDTRALLYLLFEHQSTPDRWMPLRMLSYITRIWTAVRESGKERLPVVIPVVLHHGPSGWNVARRLTDLLDADAALRTVAAPYIPEVELLIDDLARVSEVELAHRSMTALAKLTLWLLRAVRVGFDEALLTSWAKTLDEAERTAGPEALGLLVVYLTEVEGGAELLDAIVDAGVSDDVREVTMGWAKKWLEQGREEGREEGRAEGRAELLLKLLELKFGPLTTATVERVRNARLEDLDRWAERVLTASTLDTILA
jgi:predicted transposase/invertase (TIGR01784 family)